LLGVSNNGREAKDIISNINGIDRIDAVFDTTTRFMIFPVAVYNKLIKVWQDYYGCD